LLDDDFCQVYTHLMKKNDLHNRVGLIARTFAFGIVVAACCFIFSACEYDVPVTAKPTRKIEEKLLGNWTSKDGKSKMKVVKLDDSNYIVYSDGSLYRAYHSDVAGAALVTVQELDPAKPKYAYWGWKLSDDGTLSVRDVNDKIVPDETRDSASVRKLLKQNQQNPALFGDELQFTKDK
jgi:hypothetical protein